MAYPHAMFGEGFATAFVPAAIAGLATQTDPIFVAPCKCVVLAVAVTPQAAVVGNDAANKHLNILNAGAAGGGVVEVANLDLVTGVDLVASDLRVIPLNVTYTAGVHMAAGDVLVLQSELVGGGVALPNLHVSVAFREDGV